MVEKTQFEGLNAVTVKTEKLELVIVTDFGPRIACFRRPGGRNLLLWKPETYTYQDWDLRGGHRVWLTRPLADECEDTYAPDNAPCEVEISEDGCTVTGAINPINKTRRGIAVKRTSDNSVRVTNTCENAGGFLYSGGLWVLTCTVPSARTQYATPIGDGSDWDIMPMVYYRRWENHGQAGFDDPQFAIKDDVVVVTPQGKETKRMLQSPSGTLIMSSPEDGLTFAKQAAFTPGAAYPMNCNIAYYIGPDNFMVEMETMAPEQTLKPGAVMSHTEDWSLLDDAIDVTSGAGILKTLNG